MLGLHYTLLYSRYVKITLDHFDDIFFIIYITIAIDDKEVYKMSR